MVSVGRGLVENALDQRLQLGQADAAGHTLAAGLGVAQAQKIQRHIHRAEPRRVGGDAVPHVAAEVVDHLLGAVRGLDGKSGHQYLLNPVRRPQGKPAGAQWSGQQPAEILTPKNFTAKIIVLIVHDV